MKKTLLITLALGLASALPLKAVDVYITGSTAFRSQAYAACKGLFASGTLSIGYGDGNHGGNAKLSGSDTAWVMSGTATNSMDGNALSFAGSALVIHGLFTGSVQGAQSVENGQGLIFPLAVGTANTSTGTTYISNQPPTIAFCDVATASISAYNVAVHSGFAEEKVAVQPFVFVKSAATGSTAISGITNVTSQQIRYALNKGKIPYSAWSGLASDANNFVYLFNRSLDSGTLVSTEEEMSYYYAYPLPVYNYDHTNTTFYAASNTVWSGAGSIGSGGVSSGLCGTAGVGGANTANLNWGPGYIGGGDIATALGWTESQNQSIAYLSLADARNVTGVNWGKVISYNGVWPTAAGPGISGSSGSTVTNDLSPVCMGNYPFWNYEVVVYPTGNPVGGGITGTDLGNQTTAGTFLGVLDHQTKFSGGSPIGGSLEAEIQASKLATYNGNNYGATAVRLSDMTASRETVGGLIQVVPSN
jgi:hypothetical protein